MRPMLLLCLAFLASVAAQGPTIPPSATLQTDGNTYDNHYINVSVSKNIRCSLQALSGQLSTSGGKLSASVTLDCLSNVINDTAVMHLELQVGYPNTGLILFAGGGADRAHCLQTGFQTYDLCDFLYDEMSGLYNYSIFTSGSCTVLVVDKWFGGARDFYLLSSGCTAAPTP